MVGAGPSGMEAARVACERGHDVTIMEKADTVGGQVKLIGMRPGRSSMRGVIRHLEHMLAELGVPIQTGVTATPELILEQAPDAVVVATGSVPIAKPFPGDYGPPAVLNGWDVMQGKFMWMERYQRFSAESIQAGPRIGIDYADPEDRAAPLRFWLEES